MTTLTPTCFTGQKTIYAPRIDADVRRGPNAVDITITPDPRATKALLEAAIALEAGHAVHLRFNDAGVAPGRLIVTEEVES